LRKDRILSDWEGTSRVDKKGINVPLVYTKAYACYALKCAIAPDIPNNAASLAPFEITAPENSIVNALHPAPVALRHIIGHMVPDTIFDALDKLLPDRVPAEGAGCLCNFQLQLRPRRDEIAPPEARHAEVLIFNSGGSGARPTIDGLNATAFPSGVMTMPVEATEQVGPVIIWRKELRTGSGGAGQYRGGLGQYMDVGAEEGMNFICKRCLTGWRIRRVGVMAGWLVRQPSLPKMMERQCAARASSLWPMAGLCKWAFRAVPAMDSQRSEAARRCGAI
jgi:N-methylhydantoinase B